MCAKAVIKGARKGARRGAAGRRHPRDRSRARVRAVRRGARAAGNRGGEFKRQLYTCVTQLAQTSEILPVFHSRSPRYIGAGRESIVNTVWIPAFAPTNRGSTRMTTLVPSGI